MVSCFLKRAIPFALTFVVGATLGGFFKLFSSGTETRRGVLTSRYRTFEYNYGHGCPQRRNLVAESKPLDIHFKPDARWPLEARWPRGVSVAKEGIGVRVRVTFGADGRVQQVEQHNALPRTAQESVEQAARQIIFIPEIMNGEFISVTKDIEIRFIAPAENSEP